MAVLRNTVGMLGVLGVVVAGLREGTDAGELSLTSSLVCGPHRAAKAERAADAVSAAEAVSG